MLYNSIKQFHGYDLLFLRTTKTLIVDGEVQCQVTKVGTLAVFNVEEREKEVIIEALPGMKIAESPWFIKLTNDSKIFDRHGQPINELPAKRFNAKIAILVKGKKGDDQPIWSIHQIKVMGDVEEKCIL